jgi:hypothetical protein
MEIAAWGGGVCHSIKKHDSIRICSRKPQQYMLVEQCLVVVSGDQFALRYQTEETLFSLACHDAEYKLLLLTPLKEG